MPLANKEKRKAYNSKWRKENKERHAATVKRSRDRRRDQINEDARFRYARDKEKIEFRRILKLYGMSEKDYTEMYLRQNGSCAICFESKPKLVVDHCHTTGQVRGLLCTPCNLGLGHFYDDEHRILSAHAYLHGN